MSDIDAARVMIEHRGRIREVTDVLARYGLAEAADAVGEVLANLPEPGVITIRVNGLDTTLAHDAAQSIWVTHPQSS